MENEISITEASNLRYILFMLDSQIKGHDGKIFCSLHDAREYALEAIKERYCDKIAIGMFYLDTNAREMHISMVETIGFKGDKKPLSQMQLFKSS